LDEARLIIEKSKDKGFVFAQVMLMGMGDGTKTKVYGQNPWTMTTRLRRTRLTSRMWMPSFRLR
jgi:hypothetical protein